jgi:hypothetical protein
MIECHHPVKTFLVSSIDQIYVSKLGLNIQSRYLRHHNCWHRVCFQLDWQHEFFVVAFQIQKLLCFNLLYRVEDDTGPLLL